MSKEITWKILYALHELYQNGFIAVNLKNEDYIKHLQDFKRIEITKHKISITSIFKQFYEDRWLHDYLKYFEFLDNHQIIEIANNFSLEDITYLMNIHNAKDDILGSQFTKKQISSRYFKTQDSKYLKGNLEKAVLQVLKISQFPEDAKEQQFLCVLHAKHRPQAVLLCENLDRLLNPRQETIELWYAGGKNTPKLEYVPKSEIPIYYLCDWDNDGLKTYAHIKAIYFSEIVLIVPLNYKEIAKNIDKSKHDSKWSKQFDFQVFSDHEKEIINYLIENNLWIEEESIEDESFSIPVRKSGRTC